MNLNLHGMVPAAARLNIIMTVIIYDAVGERLKLLLFKRLERSRILCRTKRNIVRRADQVQPTDSGPLEKISIAIEIIAFQFTSPRMGLQN